MANELYYKNGDAADGKQPVGVSTKTIDDILPIANQSLAEGGSNDSTIMTPLKVKQSIEANQRAELTNAEVKSKYEANSNTNAFTDAQQTKLAGIEANATADMTGAEIKAAYEAQSNTNAFTDGEKSKLGGVEANATADMSDAEIKAAYERNADTNAFNDTYKGYVETNNAKVGITPTQASNISANNLKISYTDSAQVSANTGQIANHSTLIAGKEDYLGAPPADNYVLASLANGTRVWVEMTGGDSTQTEWLLDQFTAPIIGYAPIEVETNTTGSINPIIIGGDEPITSWEVSSGSLPSDFTFNTSTGVVSYDTGGAEKTGSFGVKAYNPVGASSEWIVAYEISAGKGAEQFTNDLSLYPVVRITTSNSISEQGLVKQQFYGRTTATGNGTIIEDANYPIWVADNGNGTWNYLLFPTGYSYWNFYKNSSTDPSTLVNGLSTDLTTSSLTYDLVAPTSDNFTVGSVNYPSDQSDAHYMSAQNYIDFGNDVSLNGFGSDNNSYSYGFKLVRALPDDSLGRVMFAREGRNWLGFYIGHNATYTNLLIGNGSTKTYTGETSYPSGGFAAGTYMRVTFNGTTVKIYANGVEYFSYGSASSYWDGSSSTDSLNVVFGRGIESNAYQSSTSYFHGFWQGQIERLWIANGAVISTDDDGITYPAGITHSWDLDETEGKTFLPSTGSVQGIGKRQSF